MTDLLFELQQIGSYVLNQLTPLEVTEVIRFLKEQKSSNKVDSLSLTRSIPIAVVSQGVLCPSEESSPEDSAGTGSGGGGGAVAADSATDRDTTASSAPDLAALARSLAQQHGFGRVCAVGSGAVTKAFDADDDCRAANAAAARRMRTWLGSNCAAFRGGRARQDAMGYLKEWFDVRSGRCSVAVAAAAPSCGSTEGHTQSGGVDRFLFVIQAPDVLTTASAAGHEMLADVRAGMGRKRGRGGVSGGTADFGSIADGDDRSAVVAAMHRAAVARQRQMEELTALLEDIASAATLEWQREGRPWVGAGTVSRGNRRRHRICVSVLVVHNDNAHGGSILGEQLRDTLSRRFVVKLFSQKPLAASVPMRRVAVELWNETMRVLAGTEPAPPLLLPPPDSREYATLLRQRPFFFLRDSNWPLALFLFKALQRFPVLPEAAGNGGGMLHQWQVAWTFNHSLSDVVHVLHASVAPYSFSHAVASPPLSGEPAAAVVDALLEVSAQVYAVVADRLGEATAAQPPLLLTTKDDVLLQSIAFAILYESAVSHPRTRAHLMRVASGAAGGPQEDADSLFVTDAAAEEAVTFAEEPCGVLQLPQQATARVRAELRREVLTAMADPKSSLHEILALAESGGGDGPRRTLSPRNFYHPRFDDTTRILYVLTAHALAAPRTRDRHVPLVLIQHVCQLSDEGLLVGLQHLRSTGLISSDPRAQTARSLLV